MFRCTRHPFLSHTNRSEFTHLGIGEAMQTWLKVEDDPQVLEDEIELELQAVEEDLADLDVEDAECIERRGRRRRQARVVHNIVDH